MELSTGNDNLQAGSMFPFMEGLTLSRFIISVMTSHFVHTLLTTRLFSFKFLDPMFLYRSSTLELHFWVYAYWHFHLLLTKSTSALYLDCVCVDLPVCLRSWRLLGSCESRIWSNWQLIQWGFVTASNMLCFLCIIRVSYTDSTRKDYCFWSSWSTLLSCTGILPSISSLFLLGFLCLSWSKSFLYIFSIGWKYLEVF